MNDAPIAADLRAAAQVVMGKFNDGGGALHDLVAEALAAERERCARIAERMLMSYDTMDDIPAAIRKGSS